MTTSASTSLLGNGDLPTQWQPVVYHDGSGRRRAKRVRPVVITGGAGFIGTNVASRLLSRGEKVLLYDNLSRPGVERNLRWLLQNYGNDVDVEVADIRNSHALRRALRNASSVFHFAAQVAVTTSLAEPVYDFEVNAFGTLNVLEALRELDRPVPLVFTSTNKVYGGLDDIKLTCSDGAYRPVDESLRQSGIGESRPLDFHSPYGCSKGAADQYLIDYARTYGMPIVVFRMSCIYGPHQLGTEDQGWVAHFLIRALEGQSVTIYGDGKQVRDVLYVDDLVNAFQLARADIHNFSGQAFNIGGGPNNTLSLIKLLERIEQIHGTRPKHTVEDWRPGDQRYYVSNTAKFRKATGWSPKVDPNSGVERLYAWLKSARAESMLPLGGHSQAARAKRSARPSLANSALLEEAVR